MTLRLRHSGTTTVSPPRIPPRPHPRCWPRPLSLSPPQQSAPRAPQANLRLHFQMFKFPQAKLRQHHRPIAMDSAMAFLPSLTSMAVSMSMNMNTSTAVSHRSLRPFPRSESVVGLGSTPGVPMGNPFMTRSLLRKVLARLPLPRRRPSEKCLCSSFDGLSQEKILRPLLHTPYPYLKTLPHPHLVCSRRNQPLDEDALPHPPPRQFSMLTLALSSIGKCSDLISLPAHKRSCAKVVQEKPLRTHPPTSPIHSTHPVSRLNDFIVLLLVLLLLLCPAQSHSKPRSCGEDSIP